MNPRSHRRAMGAAVLMLWIAANGCSALREIPRADYASVAERKNVRMVTRDSLQYELDYVRFEGDTVVGFRRKDVEGPVDEFGTVRVPLDNVKSLSTRALDWKRTGLVSAVVVGGVVVAGLRKLAKDNGSDSGSGEPGGIKVP